MRVYACLHSGRGPTFTKQRDIGASIIAMTVADDSRRPTIRRDATAKCQAPSARRTPTVIGLDYKGKYDVILHFMAP